MLNYLFIVITIVAFGALLFLYQEINRLKSTNQLLESKLQQTTLHVEEYKILSVQLEAEKKGAENQLLFERENNSDKQKEMKSQLELLGKDIVQQGANVLKTENEQKINALLEPLKERLLSFEKEVRNANTQDIERFTSMETIVKSLSEQHSKMHTTAQNLVDALRGEQKIQGDWGELALERILETSGLEKNREYFVQNSFRDENNNQLRPDVIIQLPDEKHIVIDSKVSLKAFEQFINDTDDTRKKLALANHMISIKNHIKNLGEKNYSHLPGINSPDFVLMFIPLESSFALAMKEEPTIYQLAWDKRVVLVTPSTLLATLKTIGSIWKQERQNRHALEIAEQAGRLYDKFVGFVADLEKIGMKQKESLLAYDSAMNKLTNGSGNLMRSAEKLKIMGAKAKKSLDKKYLDPEDFLGLDENESTEKEDNES
jgi:DNA recombination protein RmuC